MIYYLPIEPFQGRYTESWYTNIPKAFENTGHPVTVVNGEALTNVIEVGTFLDINSTVHYKAAQLQAVSILFQNKAIKDGDIFLIADLEFWGIESIRLMAQLNGISVRMVGFLHAASYTKEDAFSVAAPYQKYTELGWIAACDTVMVGSEYHKRAILVRRLKLVAGFPDYYDLLRSKITVTGNPLFFTDYPYALKPSIKKNKIILCNRLDTEKRPMDSIELAMEYAENNPNYNVEIAVTTSSPTLRSNDPALLKKVLALRDLGKIRIYENLTKAEYHQHLAESKVFISHSIEENFGYCPVEAMLFNTYPLLRSCCSHPELVGWDNRFLFNDKEEAYMKLEHLMKHEDVDVYGLAGIRLETGIKNIINSTVGHGNEN